MKNRKSKDMMATLQQKGFVVDKTHHNMFWLYYEGKKTSIRTRVSHGKKEYSSNLLSQVRRQLHLKGDELDEFFDCPLTETKYKKLLKDRKVLVG